MPFTADEKLKCLEREIKLRTWVYPKRVAGRLMTKEQADREIAIMREIAEDIRQQQETQRLL